MLAPPGEGEGLAGKTGREEPCKVWTVPPIADGSGRQGIEGCHLPGAGRS